MVEYERTLEGVMDVELGALSHFSVSAIEAVCFLTSDSLDLETLMEVVPRRRFVDVDDRTLGNPGAEMKRLGFL
jgi:hypothetical protein